VAYFKALALCEYPTKNGGKMELVAIGNSSYGRNELTNSVILVVLLIIIIIIIIIIIQRNCQLLQSSLTPGCESNSGPLEFEALQ